MVNTFIREVSTATVYENVCQNKVNTIGIYHRLRNEIMESRMKHRKKGTKLMRENETM